MHKMDGLKFTQDTPLNISFITFITYFKTFLQYSHISLILYSKIHTFKHVYIQAYFPNIFCKFFIIVLIASEKQAH